MFPPPTVIVDAAFIVFPFRDPVTTISPWTIPTTADHELPLYLKALVSEEELFDLCELSSSDKNEIDTCIENKRNNL